jgi:16S rRNA C967 or C1407 C5-methylase (RsmB/RsmF family)
MLFCAITCRRREELALAVAANEVALHQHPAWWLDALRTAWPEVWKEIAAAGNMPAADGVASQPASNQCQTNTFHD